MWHETALLADDEPLSREFLYEALTSMGLCVTAVPDGEAAEREMARHDFDLVVTDLKMPRRDGMAVLASAKKKRADLPVILVTAHGTLAVAVAALRAGADDILEKPASLQEIELALERVLSRRRLLRENKRLRELSSSGDMLVVAPAMQRIVEIATKVAASRATVLIRGESGTGKECLASLVHARSDRVNAPFVKINCAAVAQSLLESELFGHEAGAFTGAVNRKEGLFEVADRGTLFLDEVGEMAPAMQSKLLRVLQEGELVRVGGTRSIRVDVRVIAATNRDLRTEVKEGRFREDLLYRLDVVPVLLPPLRERREEIVPLAQRFLSRGKILAPGAEAMLLAHPWPGNVRELQNLIERACILCEGEVIDEELLSPWLGARESTVEIPRPGCVIADLVGKPLAVVERELISATLTHHGGNRTQAARTLGIGVRTLFNKLREMDDAGLGQQA